MDLPGRLDPCANNYIVGEDTRQTVFTADSTASCQGREEDPARLCIDVGAPLRVTRGDVATRFKFFCIFLSVESRGLRRAVLYIEGSIGVGNVHLGWM